MLIDAHSHLDVYEPADLDRALDEIAHDHILTMSVSIDAASFSAAEMIGSVSRLVIPAFGIHPWQVADHLDAVRRGVAPDLEQTAQRSPFIGEIGLDHRWVTDVTQYVPQRIVFDQMLSIAADQDKLINVHLSGAEAEAAAMIRATGLERVIVHWYSGSIDQLSRMIHDGWFFTIGVESMRSAHIREIASLIPDAQLLTETDNPGGQKWIVGEEGYPSILNEVVRHLATARGTHPEAIEELVSLNMAGLLARDPHLSRWSSTIAT